MSETLRSVLTNPVFYLVLLLVAGLARLYLKRLITAGVSHQFALRLEDHKQSLRLAAEAARYDYEHRLSQINLYATNRHAAAVEVYRALRVAHGRCVNLRGIRQDLTFEEFNESDLADYMLSYQVPTGKMEEILGRLRIDRADAIEDMRKYLQMLDVQEAQNELGRAKNISYLNELYFDDEVIVVINDCLDILDEWMAYIHFPPEPYEKEGFPDQASAAICSRESSYNPTRPPE